MSRLQPCSRRGPRSSPRFFLFRDWGHRAPVAAATLIVCARLKKLRAANWDEVAPRVKIWYVGIASTCLSHVHPRWPGCKRWSRILQAVSLFTLSATSTSGGNVAADKPRYFYALSKRLSTIRCLAVTCLLVKQTCSNEFHEAPHRS